MLVNKDGKLISVDEKNKERPIDKEQLEQVLDVKVDDLPSNSFASKEKKSTELTEKKPKVKPKIKKRSVQSKLKEAFFGEDVGNVSSYVLYQVIIPYIKKLLADSVTSAINLALFNDARPRGFSSSGKTHTSMRDEYAERASQNRNRGSSIRSRIRNVLFDDEESADAVVEYLVEHIRDYDDVSVQDFFAYCGQPIMSTDSKWGWTDLRNARVVEIYGEGWIIELPPVRPLD